MKKRMLSLLMVFVLLLGLLPTAALAVGGEPFSELVFQSGTASTATVYPSEYDEETKTVTVSATPGDATVSIYDANGFLLASGQGCADASIIADATYTVSKYGYAGQSGTITYADAADTNITLTEAAANSSIDPTVSAAWKNFRNSDVNMAVTAAPTPRTAETAVLKWAKQLGSGWSNAPSVQIIADDSLIVMANTTLYKLNLETGAIKAQAAMAAAPNFGYTPPTYAEGMIFCPLSGGKVQAFNAKTLESLWVYTDPLGGQAQSPITYSDGYIYTGFWNSEVKDANYVCLSVTDEDPTQTNEAKTSTWRKTVTGGFYWAGSVVVGDAVIFGTDDGASGSDSATAHLYSLNKYTGQEISNLTGIPGDQRSTIAYSVEKGRVYFTTKGGYLCSAALNADTGVLSDLKSVKHASQSTSTPIVYEDKVYFLSGSGVVSGSGGAGNFCVADADTLEQLYAVALQGYPQASALLSTAYLASEGKLYFYTTYNATPGGISLIKVDPTKNTADGAELVELYDAKGYEQYCIASPLCGPDGTIYYKNDSGNVLAVGTNNAYLTGLSASTGKGLEDFKAGTAEYELVVPVDTESVTFTPTAPEGAAVTLNGGESMTVALTAGAAAAEILVSVGVESRTYTISIREASTDATLKTLMVNESNSYGSPKTLTPTFSSDTYTYAAFGVGSSRKFENVWPDTNNANATVKVFAVENILASKIKEDGTIDLTGTTGGHNRYAIYFADGTQPMVIRIEVTAEDGVTKREYTMLMTRQAATEAAYAAGLTLDTDFITLKEGESQTLSASVSGQLGTGTAETLTWSSSNDAVATVDQNGKVTAVSGGTAVITVSGAMASASCTVTCDIDKTVTVAAYDYNAVAAGLTGASENGIIFEKSVDVSYDTTAADAVQAAAQAAGVPLVISTGYSTYVSSINGLAEGTGGGYSGWCLSYNNDDFANLGLGALSLSHGDRLEFHYSVNPDTTTDDVGNGWYGLPIITSFTLAGRTVNMSKETTYDASYNAVTSYYIQGNQGVQAAMQGSGTSADPFVIPVSLPSGTALTGLTASYTTQLGEHYRVVSGLEGSRDYSGDVTFTLSTLGGTQTTYYTVKATVENSGSTGGNVGGGTGSGSISVTFRLIGATLSSEDVDVGAGTGDSEYQTWIRTRSYTLDQGATVYDLFTQALADAGLRQVGADNNYVETVYAPASYGGYALSEFTNGPRSGWMYTVNGTHPSYGLKDWVLQDGDAVIWHYANDYAYEVEDWFNDPGYPALGNSGTWVDWASVPDTDPPSGSSGGDPASGKTETPAISLTPEVKADASGEAKVEISSDAIAAALEQAEEEKAISIVVAPEIKGDASKVTVELPKAAVDSIADGSSLDLTVNTPIADLTIPNEGLTDLASQNGSTVSLSAGTVTGADDGAVCVGIAVDGGIVDTVSGGITVGIHSAGSGAGTVLVRINDDGTETVIRKSASDGETVRGVVDGSCTVKTADNSRAFDDVDGHWGAYAIDFAVSHELFNGTGSGKFSPDTSMTRAMLATVLWRLEDESAVTAGAGFRDVDLNIWYTEAVSWANTAGIVTGYGNGLFGPEDSITREQMAVMLYRYAKLQGMDTGASGDLSRFPDAGQVSGYAEDAVRWAVGCGLMNGKDGGIFDPTGAATRAEVAAVCQRLVEQLVR